MKDPVLFSWRNTFADRKQSLRKKWDQYRRGLPLVIGFCAALWLALYLICRFLLPLPGEPGFWDPYFMAGLWAIPLLGLLPAASAFSALLPSTFQMRESSVRGAGHDARFWRWKHIRGFYIRTLDEDIDSPALVFLNQKPGLRPLVLPMPPEPLQSEVLAELRRRLPELELDEPPTLDITKILSPAETRLMAAFTMVVSIALGIVMGYWRIDILAIAFMPILFILFGPAWWWLLIFRWRQVRQHPRLLTIAFGWNLLGMIFWTIAAALALLYQEIPPSP